MRAWSRGNGGAHGGRSRGLRTGGASPSPSRRRRWRLLFGRRVTAVASLFGNGNENEKAMGDGERSDVRVEKEEGGLVVESGEWRVREVNSSSFVVDVD